MSSNIDGVCNCGASLSKHKYYGEYDFCLAPYREAAWSWLLQHGGIPDYYGGINEIDTNKVINHIAKCGIDFNKTSDPKMSKFSTFNGTFEDSTYYSDYFLGKLICCCPEGFKNIVDWRSRDYDGSVLWGTTTEWTIGELIFQVIKEGYSINKNPNA